MYNSTENIKGITLFTFFSGGKMKRRLEEHETQANENRYNSMVYRNGNKNDPKKQPIQEPKKEVDKLLRKNSFLRMFRKRG